MLLLLPLVVALVTSNPDGGGPPPAPPGPTPLKEIGRTRAIPACVPIVAHANGAITQALDNDRTLAILSTNLHNTDFDKLNEMQRRNAIDALLKQAGDLRIASKAADGEIKKLREYAQNANDPERKTELKTFTDALGGAIYRQAKAAAEFQKDIAILQGREEVAETEHMMASDNPVPPYRSTMAMAAEHANAPTLLPKGPPPSYDRALSLIGDTLDDLSKIILIDEGKAADHSIAATSGC